MRAGGFADVLPERDQQVVEGLPPSFREKVHQGLLTLLWRLGLDRPPAIGDSVHMDIYADRVLPECHPQHQCCGFGPHPGQCHQFLTLVWDASLVFGEQFQGQRMELNRLLPRKAHGMNQGFDLARREEGERFCGGGLPKQSLGALGGRQVSRAQAQDTRNQHKERVPGFLR